MHRPPPAIDPQQHVLFLDVDGTLLDIQAHPGDVVADDEIMTLLKALESKLGIALVSGRTIDEIDRVFSPHRFPAAGEHGARIRRPDGSEESTGHEVLPDEAFERAVRFAGERDGLLLEGKSAGFALHYRAAPDLEDACRAFMTSLKEDIDEGVRLLEGKMVLELASGASNKGTAVEAFLCAPPFSERVPFYVGDDVTDEDAFDVVNSAGGYSVRVGAAVDTAANYLLDDVRAVRQWLGSAVNGGSDGR
jgi:trehalose 6-phosphate phosphatase